MIAGARPAPGPGTIRNLRCAGGTASRRAGLRAGRARRGRAFGVAAPGARRPSYPIGSKRRLPRRWGSGPWSVLPGRMAARSAAQCRCVPLDADCSPGSDSRRAGVEGLTPPRPRPAAPGATRRSRAMRVRRRTHFSMRCVRSTGLLAQASHPRRHFSASLLIA